MNESNGFTEALRVLLGGAWSALTQLKYPMVGMPFAVILVGAFLVVFSLRLMGNVLGWSFSAGGIVSGFRQNGGNNQNIKVNETRKNDTK